MWSPCGLDHEGFTLKVIGSGGDYRYQSGALGLEVTGRQMMASVMAGWRFKFDRLEITAYVGPDFEDFKLTPDDPGTRMRENLTISTDTQVSTLLFEGLRCVVADVAQPLNDHGFTGDTAGKPEWL